MRKVCRAVNSPTRMRPYASLTEEGKKEFVLRGVVTRISKQKYSRLIARLEKKKCNLVFGEDTPARKVMQQVVTYLKDNLKQTYMQITRLMMDMELKMMRESSYTETREENVNDTFVKQFET